MATKFIQDKYARVKVKKNEPQSSIDKKRPRVVVEKEAVETTSSTLALQEPRVASSTISIEELTPCPKKFRGDDKGKDKIGIGVWEVLLLLWEGLTMLSLLLTLRNFLKFLLTSW